MSSYLNTNITTGINAFNAITITAALNVADRYVEIFLYILGVLGAILNIFTFLQKQLKSHSCSIYFLAGSLCDLCTCHVFVLVKIISLFDYQNYLQLASTSFWCKFTSYCAFMFPCLSSLCIAMASMDRFCASSRKATWRKFSTIRISRIVMPCIIFIWSLFSLHTVIAYDWRKLTPNATTLLCSPTLDVYTFFVVIDGYFFALFNGVIIPFLLTIFGILIIFHVRETQRRRIIPVLPPLAERNNTPITIRKNSNPLMNRESRHLIIMLLVQVVITIIVTLPYIIVYIRHLYDTVIIITTEYLSIVYITTWLWYLNYCKTFYVNTMSSQFYRSILKKQLLRLYHKLQPLE